MTSAKKYAFKTLFNFITVDGKSVTPQQAKERLKICSFCPKLGKVQPLPGLEMEGCKICGCPSSTKPHMKSIMRAIDKAGDPLTLAEMVELKTKDILGDQRKVEQTIVCPHPDGNKWEAVDNKF